MLGENKMTVKELKEKTIELCTCGHLKSSHSDLTVMWSEKENKLQIFRHPSIGDGGCCKCNCRQFTFKKFVGEI